MRNSHRQRRFFLLAVFLFCGMTTALHGMTIRIPAPEGEHDPRYSYFVQQLQLALDHSPLKGQYRLASYPREVTQSRAFGLMNAGEIDLLWSMTDIKREEQFLPVRIPLTQGLLGYRVILINKRDEQNFARMSAKELRQLPCHQGADWPDTTILTANHFKVRGVSDYKRIHLMLDKGNIRCFPRGILEAWGEIESKNLKNTMVDRHFLLVYPTDAYFFVHKNNQALADQLELGLRAAIADGSFARLLFSYPAHRMALDKAELQHRQIIYLHNPLLPAKTPLQEQQLWFSPSGAPRAETDPPR